MANLQQQITMPDVDSAVNSLATIQMPNVPNASEVLDEQKRQEIAQLLESVNIDSLMAELTGQGTGADGTNKPESLAWLLGDTSLVNDIRPTLREAGNRDDSRNDRREGEYNSNTSLDGDLPGMLSDFTGEDTWGGLADKTGKAIMSGIAGMVNPTVGAAVASAFNAAEDGEISGEEAANIAEDAALGFTGLGMVAEIAESVAEFAGVYSKEDGILNSIRDVLDGEESINTVAGFYAAGGVEGQQNRIAAAIEAAGGDPTKGSDPTTGGLGGNIYGRISFGERDKGEGGGRGTGAHDGGLGSGSFGGASFGGRDDAGSDASTGGLGSGSFGDADFGGDPAGRDNDSDKGDKGDSDKGDNDNDGSSRGDGSGDRE